MAHKVHCLLNTKSFYHGLLWGWEFSYSAPHHAWGRQRQSAIVVAQELLIWDFLVLFHYQAQAYKQNLTNLNNVYGCFSVTYV